MAPTAAAAAPLAAELDRLNRERREVEAVMQEDALRELEARADAIDAKNACTVCIYRPDWHQGVVGILASRLKDRFHRPAIVFARGGDEGELRGSGRSIAGFHLRDALDLVAKRAPGLLRRFGGHAFAAGMTLAEQDLPRFVELFEAIARDELTPAQLHRTLETDGELDSADLDLDLATLLRREVWGQGFPAPSFDGHFIVASQRVIGSGHLRLTLKPTEGRDDARYQAMLFNRSDPLPTRIRAVYRPEANDWNGTSTLQLVIEHWLAA